MQSSARPFDAIRESKIRLLRAVRKKIVAGLTFEYRKPLGDHFSETALLRNNHSVYIRHLALVCIDSAELMLVHKVDVTAKISFKLRPILLIARIILLFQAVSSPVLQEAIPLNLNQLLTGMRIDTEIPCSWELRRIGHSPLELPWSQR